MKLGLFSPGFINPSASYNKTLDDLFILAPLAEDLGFSRFWIGEHYEWDIAWRNPEIILAILAGITSKIRIGAAGVLLRLHSPLLVAQNYKLLEYLFSNRIDFGIAKGKASDKVMAELGQFNNIQFEEMVNKLFDFFHSNDLSRSITTPPYYNGRPQIWFLGRSSYELAIQHKANVCLSLFNSANATINKDELSMFRNKYFEKWNELPDVIISLAGICQSSREKAVKINRKRQNTFCYPSLIGNDKDLNDMLSEMCDNLSVDEFVFLDLCTVIEEKIESCTLLSQNFKLNNP